MDEEAEKEFERIRNLSYDEMVAEGLIIPARNPQRIFEMPIFKLEGNKTSTELLMEMRAEERY
jgi:hypothetical protein